MPNLYELPQLWKQNLTPRLDVMSQRRVESLGAAFRGLEHSTVVTNTEKQDKANAQLVLIQELLGLRLVLGQDAHLYRNVLPELAHPQALRVAFSKAFAPVRNPQGILGEVKAELISLGADVNAFLNGKQQHKYERSRASFTEQKIEAAKKELIQQYCFPPSGRVHIIWDLGTHIVNGAHHQFGDQIELISRPVDPELMMKYLDQAMVSGLFWSSNLHFGALECLIENQGILSLAFLPKELKDQGMSFAELRVRPTPELQQQALHSVVTNAPLRYN